MDAEAGVLRERAAALRAEAYRLLRGTGALEVIHDLVGTVEVVGSVDLDLMVWPDIDLYTRLHPHEGQRLLSVVPALHGCMERQGYPVVRASFNDEYRRPGTPYGEGLYCGWKLLSPDRERVWKIDLWAWDDAAFEAKMAEHQQLARSLARADRDLVLRIKDAVHVRREYRDTITSRDVYDFALSGHGTSIRDFDDFVARRGDG